ncbi:MAG: MFS transporter, partial [Chloroflexota bacterium]
MSDPLPEQAADPQQTNEMRGLETPSVAPSIPHGFRGVIQNRAFLSLWAAQVASQTAQNTLWFVLIVLVSQLTGQSTLSTGITIILVQLPTVLFSGVSGVFVDRLPKRSILIGTNVIRVGGVLLYILFQHDVGLLYLITFLIAIVSQPFAPAEGSTIPLLVKGQQLISANSLFQLTFMGSQAVGFAVAPIALGFLGTRVTLIMLAAMFAFAAVVLIGLPASTRKHVSWGKLGAVE